MYNLPLTPGALLGYRKSGQPIHLIAGGSGEGDQPAEPSKPIAEPATQPNTPAPEPTPPADPPAPAAQTPPSDVSQLPDWAQKLLADTRKEAGDHRVKLREAEATAQAAKTAVDELQKTQQQQREALAKFLGYSKEDEPPDPKVLAEQLAAAKAETDARMAEKREADVMLAVHRAASKHDADAEALLDSRAFQLAVKDLDPSAADFADRIGEAITKAVENNPRYKLTPAAPPPKPKPEPTVPKSGAPMNGAPGGNRQWTDADVAAATPQEVTKAIADGLLIDLGVNPPKPKR